MDVSRFVEFINPKQIVVLGDIRFVPQYYITSLGSKCDILTIDSDNWFTNATTLGNLLDYKALPQKYQDGIAKYESGKTEPDKKSDALKPEAAPAKIQPSYPAQGIVQPPKPVEQSPETMILMPPSQGVDEPVLLVPFDTAPTPSKRPVQK